MPIILPEHGGDPFLAHRLEQAGALVITTEQASRQETKPARIGLLNLMPGSSMEATEAQWLTWLGDQVLQIEFVPIKFDDDEREAPGKSRAEILSYYRPFSEAVAQPLHGLIVTGDNLELDPDSLISDPQLLALDQIRYYHKLCEIMDWARTNVYSTIYSCLASHIALGHIFGLEREPAATKTFGVYRHNIVPSTMSGITYGMDDYMAAPHSRWGNIPSTRLTQAGVDIAALNLDIGWLIAEAPNLAGGYDLFMQGHPEYGRYDLHKEYQRDEQFGQVMPDNYYTNGNVAAGPELSWANAARALHGNWIRMIYNHFAN